MEDQSADKTARRVAKNTAAQAARFAAIAVSKFAIVVVIGRALGVEVLGDFSFVMTFTLALSFLNSLGLELLMMREIAHQRERIHEYVGNALTLSVGLGVVSVPIMGGIASWLGYSDAVVAAVYLVAVALIFDTLGEIFRGAFGGYERMELGTLAIVVQEVGFLLAGSIVLFLHLPMLWVYGSFIASRLLGFLATARIYARCWGRPPRPRFDWTLTRILIRKTGAYGLNKALSPVFTRIDILLLSYLTGNVAVGFYEVASTLFYRLNVFARMLNLALIPLIAREFATKGSDVVDYVRRAVKYQAVLALPISVACWLLGDKIVTVLFGAAFESAGMAFRVLATATIFRFVGNTLASTLTAIDLQGRRSLSLALIAVMNIGLNMVAVPRYGYMGAAVTSVLTEIGYFCLLLVFVRSRLPNPIPPAMLIKPSAATAVMALPLLLLGEMPLVVLLPVAVTVYGMAVLGLRVFTAEEMGFLLRTTRMESLIPSSLRWILVPSALAPEQGPK